LHLNRDMLTCSGQFIYSSLFTTIVEQYSSTILLCQCPVLWRKLCTEFPTEVDAIF